MIDLRNKTLLVTLDDIHDFNLIMLHDELHPGIGLIFYQDHAFQFHLLIQ